MDVASAGDENRNRGSPLALIQAGQARDAIARTHGLDPQAIAIVAITTTGDRERNRSLAEIGGKGLFTKEIEEALLAGAIDVAVHSMKDMPARLPDGLVMAAMLARGIRAMPSCRRWRRRCKPCPGGAARLVIGEAGGAGAALRPDLEIVPFQGQSRQG